MDRRTFIASCGCVVFASGLHAQEQDEDFFICGTEQITDALTTLQNLSNSGGGVTFDEGPTSGGDVELDPYSTAQRSLRWTAGKTRREHEGKPSVLVGFVDGTADQQGAVRSISQEWLRHGIDVHFEFTDRVADALVRITFEGGNQSSVGSAALAKPRGEATMQLADVRPGVPDRRVRRVILHEFGHGIMTFGHEHRHPDSGYRFKSDTVIRDSINSMLRPGQRQWSIGMVKTNITDPPYPRDRVCGPYDIKSIMHYPILPTWLEAGTPVPQEPAEVSPIDIRCAVETYDRT
jgi:hypothetical protein